MEMEHSMDPKSMLSFLMFLAENINVGLYNLISNFHKDLICNLDLGKLTMIKMMKRFIFIPMSITKDRNLMWLLKKEKN